MTALNRGERSLPGERPVLSARDRLNDLRGHLGGIVQAAGKAYERFAFPASARRCDATGRRA